MNNKMNTILKEAATLTAMEQLELIESIIYLMKQTRKENNKWDDIYGIGKGIWEGIDAQDYVNQMREDRI
ncbi:MAG: hypothetical protein ABRQ37_01495 [Candidatus Eremiobacterota bacterium]